MVLLAFLFSGLGLEKISEALGVDAGEILVAIQM